MECPFDPRLLAVFALTGLALNVTLVQASLPGVTGG